MIILFYGQPASGKTTIADAFCKKMTNDYYYHFSKIIIFQLFSQEPQMFMVHANNCTE
jgi:adenylate kinase family enzyme